MKNIDLKTIRDYGIPARQLMENAGNGCASYLIGNHDHSLKRGVVVLCGHGNNGGDGYVLARILHEHRYPVTVIDLGEGTPSPETRAGKELCEKLKIEFVRPEDHDYAEMVEEVLSGCGVIVDAIYGIGFRGRLQGAIAAMVEEVNATNAFRVAIDMPSGVHADTGYAELAFEAHLTLTMEVMKYGQLLGRGRQCCGQTSVVSIGIPMAALKQEQKSYLMTLPIALLPERDRCAHKGDCGRLAMFAGSPGFTGAAFLAAQAALRAGAGLVTLFCHPEHFLHYVSKPQEVMVKPVPLLEGGELDIPALQTELEKYDALLLGPGCGMNDHTARLLKFVTEHWQKPAVIDADGLNALALHPELYGKLSGRNIILTPHWGEFCRLAKVGMGALHNDCLSELRKFVEAHNLQVLLKSHTSIYCDSSTTFFNTSGNDGLATGGSGDILAGLITSFLGQKMSPRFAAGSAAFHLGYTAELLAGQRETFSITPTDILDNIFAFLEEDETAEE